MSVSASRHPLERLEDILRTERETLAQMRTVARRLDELADILERLQPVAEAEAGDVP
jgi:hypothetical protein